MLLNIILTCFWCVVVIVVSSEDSKKTFEELVEEKNDLLKQINEAIDVSVKSLQKLNDSDTIIGLKYMNDLKEYMRRVNESDITGNDRPLEEDSRLDLENRRTFKNLGDSSQLKKAKRISKDIFDIDKILKPKKASPSKWREILENRQKMQKKLDEWILEREKEKERIEKYKLSKKQLLLSGKYEKCPRFGYEGKRKRESRGKMLDCEEKIFGPDGDKNYEKCRNLSKTIKDRNAKEGKRVRSSSQNKNKYPCCRKCCKKSYLGCL